jgi:hypothetical protein
MAKRKTVPKKQLENELKFIRKYKLPLLTDEHPFSWKTSDGRKVHPSELSDEHLRNCVSFTQRQLIKVTLDATFLDRTIMVARAYYEFLKEAKRRGMRV